MTDDRLNELMSPQPSIVVRSLAAGPNFVKCPRCWHYHGVRLNHDSLCDGCCITMMERWPAHEQTPAIRKAWDAQRATFTKES